MNKSAFVANQNHSVKAADGGRQQLLGRAANSFVVQNSGNNDLILTENNNSVLVGDKARSQF